MPIPPAADFRFDSEEDLFDLGGVVSRFNHNVATVTLLKRLEASAQGCGQWRRSRTLPQARTSTWSQVARSRTQIKTWPTRRFCLKPWNGALPLASRPGRASKAQEA